MAKKRLSISDLQANQLSEQQQLNTKGGYLIIQDKRRISQTKFIVDDELDIRRPIKAERNSLG